MTHATNAGENPKKTTQHDFLGAKPWKFFEKLVAAIHRAEMQGAEVKWNDEIDGRQFDVTVRFTRGPYSYLTVIECKDWNRPVPAEKVEALVTKAGDVKADKAVMVSASGFQSGCSAVAEKHGIELFTVEEIRTVPDDLLVLKVYRMSDVLTLQAAIEPPAREAANEPPFALLDVPPASLDVRPSPKRAPV